jgi:hypothetical protein
MALADLRFVGAPVDDPVATARFIAGMVLTKRQKAALLKTYLSDTGRSLSSEIRTAADQYAEHL